MSHAGTIIGIPGLEVIRVKRRRGIEVWDSSVPNLLEIVVNQRLINIIQNHAVHLEITPGFE